MDIFWTKSTNSGIGDRMIDLCLMAAYAKVCGGSLYLKWNVLSDGHIQTWVSDNKLNQWKDIRYVDYLYDNIKNYFTFPNNVMVNQEPTKEYTIFNHYLGGIYSPKKFYNHFVRTVDYDTFLKYFFEVTSEIQPKERLKSIVGNTTPTLSVHLRRQDKIRENTTNGDIHINELTELNRLTQNVFNKIYKGGTVYISSDDEIEKNKFKDNFKSISVDDYTIHHEFEKTYVDLYMLSKSKTIILSQKHSNFSLFASLLNKSDFVYLYDSNCHIDEFGFDELDNLFFYKDFFEFETHKL